MGTLVARVFGGLGNQLFIYAASKAAAEASGRRLLLDTQTGFERDLYQREYLLDCYAINSETASSWQSYAGRLGRCRRWVHRRWAFHRRWGRGPVLVERGSYFDPELLQLPSGANTLYLEGYWQSPRYFQSIRDTLLRELVPVAPLTLEAQGLAERMRRESSVCVHIRTYQEITDGGAHWRVDMSYYDEAIAWMQRKLRQPQFFVFSDNVSAAREALRNRPDVQVVDINVNGGKAGPVAELHLMSKCRHFIVANSTFGWWAAWLAAGAEKRVVAPNRPQQLSNCDFYPDDWVLL